MCALYPLSAARSPETLQVPVNSKYRCQCVGTEPPENSACVASRKRLSSRRLITGAQRGLWNVDGCRWSGITASRSTAANPRANNPLRSRCAVRMSVICHSRPT